MEITLTIPEDLVETLASLPAPEEVLALRPSSALQEQIEALLEEEGAGGA